MALGLFTGTTFAQSIKKTAVKAKATTTAVADTAKHLKKDGTADKRFKSSKTAATSAVKSTTKHLKKDGTPDMRFKENKKS